ncbi:hypothetical protein ACR79S_03070 [Sphingobacterium spiritivorum]|uniref:hypothetical protein n=1 Tax=Sphingobacterium TaxID=28453 RepID=UPI0028A80D08|nr:hypothetical protein [Sphingobacterium sp.]
MKITDLHGCRIEIPDLNEAIRIAEECTEYQHEDKSFSEFDKRLKVYWSDLYEKENK